MRHPARRRQATAPPAESSRLTSREARLGDAGGASEAASVPGEVIGVVLELVDLEGLEVRLVEGGPDHSSPSQAA